LLNSSKKVLVTGASGFLGTAVCTELKSSGYHVIELSSRTGCISNANTLSDIPKIDFVVHLAGILSVEESWLYPLKYNLINVNGTTNVLELCRKHGATMVYCSSYVYGAPAKLPVSELHEIVPTNPYTLSKVSAETMCELYHQQHGVKCKIFRPFNIYGPGQSEKLLLGRIFGQLKRHNKIEIRNVATKRDFIHVLDIAKFVNSLLDYNSDFDVFNVGSGQSISISEVITLIQELMDEKVHITQTHKDFHDPIIDCFADISKADEKLNWKPLINIKTGLSELVEDMV
jgi:UDP-glucose 4-epimerase